MKEAFKIGGYAWHAHKRFESIKKGWSFEKTVLWLHNVGIRFATPSILRFVNVYSTYTNQAVVNASLTESYRLVNDQAAKVFAVTERTIQRWKPESLKQKRLSQEEVEKIHEMKEEGKTNTEIAKELEVEEGAIRHHIRKLENFPIYDPNSPTPGASSPEPTEPSNIISSPVRFKKQEPVDDYNEEDEEDLDIETPTTRSSW